MNKRLIVAIKAIWRIHWSVWLALVLVGLTISVVALRHNNQEMAKLRANVYSADKNNKNVEQAIEALSSYVYSHMNTSLTTPNGIYPPIQLTYTYQRLVAQANNKVAQAANTYCHNLGRQPNGYYGAAGITCAQSYNKAHPVNTDNIPQQLYEFDFVSPTWSPDLAGWSLLASALCLALFSSRFMAHRLSRD